MDLRTQPRNQTNAADDEGFKDQGSNNQGLRIQEFNHGNYGRSQQWRIHRFKDYSIDVTRTRRTSEREQLHLSRTKRKDQRAP
ncbi:hypothetical protein KQX54_000995 [Cotesia glomerata]|uniref:Uncharacterized protein n=1 Tax=Cotesia glomerata TaxID=32391 RepID=A0AAV7HN05_COTGL|nr:hypothetical protein KQX54_000995 [Cotesia glomerata]